MRQRLKLRKYFGTNDIEKILKLAGIRENNKIMDYGTGIGTYALKAAEFMNNSGSIIAVDINPKMLKQVDNIIEKKRIRNIKTLLIKDLEDIEDNGFNYIFLIDVLQFFKDKISVINFLKKKLSTDGSLLIRFDHLDQEQIQSIFEKCNFSVKRQIYKEYWILA